MPQQPDRSPVTEATWAEFRSTGLLWWVNRGLQLFGWMLVFVEDGSGKLTRVYPARTSLRGFSAAEEAFGFKRLSTYVNTEAERLVVDADRALDPFINTGSPKPA
jgi:hypothetical protein